MKVLENANVQRKSNFKVTLETFQKLHEDVECIQKLLRVLMIENLFLRSNIFDFLLHRIGKKKENSDKT